MLVFVSGLNEHTLTCFAELLSDMRSKKVEKVFIRIVKEEQREKIKRKGVKRDCSRLGTAQLVVLI